MSYAIADEPRPSALRNLVVHPSAPLLGLMLGGAWLAWPWFVVNAIALGSPTRRKEIALTIISAAGTVALAYAALALDDMGVIASRTEGRLALLAITTWKLGLAYWVCIVQAHTFHVYTYYGGTARSALYVLVAGFLLRQQVLHVVDDPLWLITTAGGLG